MDIIILFFLARHIGEIARAKGLSVGKWRLIAVLVWIALELPVVLLSAAYTQNLLIASLSGILAGLLGYLVLRQRLENLPAAGDDRDQP